MKILANWMIALGLLATTSFADRSFIARPTAVAISSDTTVIFRLAVDELPTEENNEDITQTTWLTLSASIVPNSVTYERLYTMLLTALSTSSAIWVNCTGSSLLITHASITNP